MTTNAEPQPNTVIARIIEELNASPELKPVLLRAMLTDEFLLLPNKVDRLTELYGELSAKVSELSATVGELAITMDKLAAKVGELAIRVDRLDTQFDRMNGHMGNLLGEKYERRIARSIRSHAHSELGIRRAKVLLGETTTDYESLPDAAMDARTAGIVSKAQTDSLARADYVLYGTDVTTGLPCAATVEVSITIDRRDIERAAERSVTLGQVMGCTAVAAVVGDSIDAIDQQRAETAGVKVLIISE